MPRVSETNAGFRFSLRTLLIALIVVGVVAGVMGRLYFRNADIFLGIVAAATTIGPFLLAIITIIWIGVRTGRVKSIPICRECRSDLRWLVPGQLTMCPDCQADLSGEGAVQFVPGRGGGRRRWGLVVWGCVLAFTPFVGLGTVILVQSSYDGGPARLQVLTTKELIQQRLPNEVDQPWVWNELKRRQDAGLLTRQDVDAAVKELVKHMTATAPEGWNQGLSWQGEFLKAAAKANKISDPVLFDLADAYYGVEPRVVALPRIRETAGRFDLNVKYGTPWNDPGFGIELLWQVTRVDVDGQPVEFKSNYRNNDAWSGRCQGTWTAGDHELTVEVDSAYVDPAKLIGLNARDLPMERWPKARKQWTTKVKAPLKVYTADEPIVPLTTDAGRDPVAMGEIRVQRFVAQSAPDGKTKIILTLEIADELSIPLSFDASAVLGDQEIQLGNMWVYQTENRRSSGGRQLQQTIDNLDPAIRSGQIILTPNPRHIEQKPDVKEIWGKRIVIGGYPIERLDLEAGRE